MRIALLLTSGLAVGVLTSFGQGHLTAPLNAFVNSASAWLVAPFFVGSRMRSRRGATGAGLAVCLLPIVGYYAATELRPKSAPKATAPPKRGSRNAVVTG
jgi:Family of unknown function (DUF6518)